MKDDETIECDEPDAQRRHLAVQQRQEAEKVKDDETVECDEPDAQCRHLAVQQKQEAGYLAGCTAFPSDIVVQIPAAKQHIRHPNNNNNVDTHQ